jgi:hypothetical protein
VPHGVSIREPVGRTLEKAGFWLPSGATETNATVGGTNTVTGTRVTNRTFMFEHKPTGRRQTVSFPMPEGISEAEAEDMLASSFERFVEDCEAKGPIVNHTPEKRKEIGAAIRDVREYAARRSESSLGKRYYDGI